MSLEIRQHGRWKFRDWFWLAPFVLVASLLPAWRRKYWTQYVTVSLLTNTVYTPDGSISIDTLAHEERHVSQAERDGLARFGLRYLRQHWRIWYEAEAFYIQGRSAQDTVRLLRSMYFILWPEDHVTALVLWARSGMRLRGL